MYIHVPPQYTSKPIHLNQSTVIRTCICADYLNYSWDEELIELAQTWTPKENSKLAIN